MKIYIPINKGWYLAAFCLFSPIIFINIIEPEWQGRFLGILIQTIVAQLYLIIVVLNPRSRFFKENSPLYIKFAKNKVDLIIRLIILILASLFFVFYTLLVFKDFLLVINKDAPLERTSLVARTGQGKLLIMETLFLDDKIGSKENTFQAFYFAPRYIMHKNTYKFLYLPNSHFIIDAELVSENTNQ